MVSKEPGHWADAEFGEQGLPEHRMTDAEMTAIKGRADALWRDIGSLTLAEARTSPLPTLFADLGFLIGEHERLTAITSRIRRCDACHREILNGRAVTDEDEREAAE
jgi:hypothetical protein